MVSIDPPRTQAEHAPFGPSRHLTRGSYASAVDLGVPERFNLSSYLVDRHVAAGRADALALVDADGATTTYGELHSLVAKAGSALRDLGLGMEDRVALLMNNEPAFVQAFLGAIRIGAVPVPLNTLAPITDYGRLIARMRASVVVVSAALARAVPAIRSAVPDLRHIVVVGADLPGTQRWEQLLDGASTTLTPAETSRDDMAFWLLSSGTTGLSKMAVHLQHDAVVVVETLGRAALDVQPTDRFLSVSKFFHSWGIGPGLLLPLGVGGTALCNPGAVSAQRMLSLIDRLRPTVFSSYPGNLGRMVAVAPAAGGDVDLSCVRLALSSGERLSPELAERFSRRFGITLLDGIGSTEMLGNITASVPGHSRPGSCGRPVPGVQVRLVGGDRLDAPTKRGWRAGELHVRTDSTIAGYWLDHEKTKAAVHGEWINTGDWCELDPDDYLYYRGRRDDFVKIDAEWVNVLDTERALLGYPHIQEVGVVVDIATGPTARLVAYVVPVADGDPAAMVAELTELARDTLPPAARPGRYEIVESLPRTATGKLKRAELRAEHEESAR